MTKKLIPFYSESYRHHMGYKLFIDRNTMKIYRVYDDSYRVFENGRYWGYHFGGYGVLTAVGGITMYLSFISSVLVLLIISGTLFWAGNYYVYKKVYENMDLKDVYITKDEFIEYVQSGRRNARVLMIGLAVCILVFLALLIFYLSAPTIGLLLMLTFTSFLIGVFKGGIPYERLRMHYQNDYLEKVANEVQDQLAQ